MLDTFTYNTLVYGGGAKTLYGYYPNENLPGMVLLAYVVLLCFLAFVLARILFILPGFFYAGLVWVSYGEQRGLIAVIFLALWMINRVRMCYRKRDSPDHPCVTFARTSSGAAGVNMAVHPASLIVLLLGLVVALGPKAYADNLRFLFVIALVMYAGYLVPGVGGHSTAGLIGLVLIGFLGMMVFPEVVQALVDALVHAIKPQVRGDFDPIMGAATMAETVMSNNGWALSVTMFNASSVVRVMIGFMITWWFFFDDIFGPGATITQATKVKNRNPEKIDRVLACNFSSHWVTSTIFTLGFYAYAQQFWALGLYVVSGVLSGLLWKMIGESVWAGRGMAATATEMRGGMMLNFGEGPTALRTQITTIGFGLSLFQLALVEKLVWPMVAFLAVFFLMRNAKTRCLGLGLATWNITLVWYAIRMSDPINQDIHDQEESAYVPTAGFNNSGGDRGTRRMVFEEPLIPQPTRPPDL